MAILGADASVMERVESPRRQSARRSFLVGAEAIH